MSRPLSLRWTLGQTPQAVRWLIAATALISIVTVVSARNDAPILLEGLLVVPQVFRGQVWRLATWVFYELNPLALVFNCLTLYWIGSDLARRLGRRAFLASYFGLAAIAATVTCLVGLFWASVAIGAHGGSWPVLLGLIVAWGRMFPERPLRFWGILPLFGRHLVPIAIGGTVLFALYYGLPAFIPHFTAELVALASGPISKRMAARKKALMERAARGEAWSFDAWFEKEKRRRK